MQQAAIQFQPPSLSLRPTKPPTGSRYWPKSLPPRQTPCLRAVKACSSVPNDTSMIDYSSMSNSVFPAEACETLGGEACNVEEMYPEVKNPPTPIRSSSSSETVGVDTEYYEYSSSKTVFVEEACDDLGGEFCNPDYQKGDNN